MYLFEPLSFNHPTIHSLSFKKPSVAPTQMAYNVSKMKTTKIYSHPSFVVYITFSLFIDILFVTPLSSHYFLLPHLHFLKSTPDFKHLRHLWLTIHYGKLMFSSSDSQNVLSVFILQSTHLAIWYLLIVMWFLHIIGYIIYIYTCIILAYIHITWCIFWNIYA